MGIGLAISLVVSGITKLVSIIDDAIHAIDRQKEKVEELKQELQTATSELENINLELETAAKRVDELNSKNKLTFAEQGELENLKDITKELLIQQDIAEKRTTQSAKELAQGAADLFNKQYDGQNFSKEQVQEYIKNAKISGNNAILASDENNISAFLAAYQQFVDLKNEATNTDDIEHFNGILEELKNQLWDNVSGLQEIKSNLEAVPLDERNADLVKMSEYASQGIQLIYNQLDPSKWAEINFGEIFNAEEFSSVKSELESLASQGKLTAETFKNPAYNEISKALANAGISAEQAANQINALNQSVFAMPSVSPALSFDEVNKQIDSLQGAYQSLTSIVADYNTNQYMTIDNLQSLLALGNDYLQYLTMENGQLRLNQEGMLALANARIDDAEATYLQQSIDLMKTFSDQKIAADYLKDSLKDLSGARLADAEAAYAQAMADAMATGGDMASAAQKLNGVVENTRRIFDQTRSSLGSYSSAVMGAASATSNAANEMKQAMSSAQSAIQSLLSMTMNMIKQQYNDQKKDIQGQLDALNDRYNAEKNHLEDIGKEKKKQFDDEKKALQDELEGYRKKIDAQLELIRAKESERDYQNELSEKQEDVSDIEADLASTSLDTSEEGVRRRLELEAQLAEKRKELEEFQHDKSIQDQEDALNKELSNFEDQINSKLDLLEIESQRYEEIHQERMDEIDAEYEYERELLNQRQQDIEEQVSNESAIRAEAIQMIEDKNSGLYEKLLEKQTAPFVQKCA